MATHRKAQRPRKSPDSSPPRSTGGAATPVTSSPQEESNPVPSSSPGGASGRAFIKPARPSALIDTRVIYCGDCLEQLRKLTDACIDLIYIDPPFNSNRNDEVFWGETKEKRAFEDRHDRTRAYIDTMRPRCVELARGAQEKQQVQLPPRLATNE